MNIVPNSTIILLKNVPLDNTYTDTIYFDNLTDQVNHFSNSYTSKVFNLQTYQRVNKNRIRLEVVADDIYDYNYLMFRNTAYGNKWFYCFITQTEWINNQTSEIEYEIDDIQTWLFDVNLKPCYVEREHSIDDWFDETLNKTENIDTGDIICNSMHNFHATRYAILVGYLPKNLDPSTDLMGKVIGGNLFSGLEYEIFDITNPLITTRDAEILRLRQMLADYTSSVPENIIFIKCVPYSYIDSVDGMKQFDVNIPKPTNDMNNGYTPRNKKLLRYPYNFINIDTGNDNRNYRYEWFFSRDNICHFKETAVLSDDMNIYVAPISYNGSAIGTPTSTEFVEQNPNESVICGDFPNCSWRSEGQLNAIVNLGRQLGKNIIGGGIYSAITGSPTIKGLGLSSSVSSVVDILTCHNSSTFKGGGGDNCEVALNLKGVFYKYMSITYSYAKMIDDYFEKYGYICNELKIPNRDVRPHWCYCKTNDCNITGKVPTTNMNNIKRIYNKGITWWKNGSEVGDYTLDNRIFRE